MVRITHRSNRRFKKPNLIVISFSTLFVFILSSVFSISTYAVTTPITVVKTIHVGNIPWGIAYDSRNQEIYVANSASGSVSAINTSSNSVIATVAVGMSPQEIVFDPHNNEVYVANGGSDTVSVISGASNLVVKTINVDSGPLGVAFNPYNNEIYVANNGNGAGKTVSVINAKTNSLLTTVRVGSAPWSLGYVALNHDIYVANDLANTVSVINSSNKVVATIAVGTEPWGVGFDSTNNDIYVSNWGASTISVISASTNKVVKTLPAVSGGSSLPYAIVSDKSNGNVYVTHANGCTPNCAKLFVINGTTNTISAQSYGGQASYGIALYPSKNLLYVTDIYLNEVFVISS